MENLYCKSHKYTNKEYRENYDRIFKKEENNKKEQKKKEKEKRRGD